MDKTIIKELQEHDGFKYTTILPKNMMYEERQMWWVPVVPGTREAEAGEWREPRRWGN